MMAQVPMSPRSTRGTRTRPNDVHLYRGQIYMQSVDWCSGLPMEGNRRARWSANGRARLGEGPAVALDVVRLVGPVAMPVNFGHDRGAAGPGPGAVGLQVIDEHPGHMPERHVARPGPIQLEDDQRGVSQVELDPPTLGGPVLVGLGVGAFARRLEPEPVRPPAGRGRGPFVVDGDGQPGQIAGLPGCRVAPGAPVAEPRGHHAHPGGTAPVRAARGYGGQHADERSGRGWLEADLDLDVVHRAPPGQALAGVPGRDPRQLQAVARRLVVDLDDPAPDTGLADDRDGPGRSKEIDRPAHPPQAHFLVEGPERLRRISADLDLRGD